MNLYGNMRDTDSETSCVCDLRSDTLTRPGKAMREAISSASVGDDVYGEDPTVNTLELRTAELLGKEAAVFFPTGTQSNLAAIMAHCGRGDEVIVGNGYHIYCHEAAGASVLAGLSLNPVPIEAGGEITPLTVKSAIKDDDPHYARSRLLCLENTVDGRAVAIEHMQAAAQAARDAGLGVHLDGARFFNATTALDCDPQVLANCADSVSVCMSKGLGAPVGSVLTGSKTLIRQARRNRKILGGAMRQAGVLAAAALYALDHHLPDLAQDHVRAAKLAKELRDLDVGDVRLGTNMVFFTPAGEHHAPLLAHMHKTGVRIGGQSPAIRMVLHRDLTDAGLEQAIAAFKSYYTG